MHICHKVFIGHHSIIRPGNALTLAERKPFEPAAGFLSKKFEMSAASRCLMRVAGGAENLCHASA